MAGPADDALALGPAARSVCGEDHETVPVDGGSSGDTRSVAELPAGTDPRVAAVRLTRDGRAEVLKAIRASQAARHPAGRVLGT